MFTIKIHQLGDIIRIFVEDERVEIYIGNWNVQAWTWHSIALETYEW